MKVRQRWAGWTEKQFDALFAIVMLTVGIPTLAVNLCQWWWPGARPLLQVRLDIVFWACAITAALLQWRRPQWLGWTTIAWGLAFLVALYSVVVNVRGWWA